jgi:glutathione peroxidase-family protein
VNALPTPAGGARIGLNYEKFLLDHTGKPLRRYPRKYPVAVRRTTASTTSHSGRKRQKERD